MKRTVPASVIRVQELRRSSATGRLPGKRQMENGSKVRGGRRGAIQAAIRESRAERASW